MVNAKKVQQIINHHHQHLLQKSGVLRESCQSESRIDRISACEPRALEHFSKSGRHQYLRYGIRKYCTYESYIPYIMRCVCVAGRDHQHSPTLKATSRSQATIYIKSFISLLIKNPSQLASSTYLSTPVSSPSSTVRDSR
jgi:hypothetical protein